MNSYRRLCTLFYDIDKPHPPADALAFYQHYAHAARGPILETMSGSGRFLLPLLAQGFDIDGVDASPEMLQACRETAAKHGLHPVLYEQFLEKMDVPRRYNLVIIPAGSFCLLTEPGQVQHGLAHLHAAMNPGAKLVMEVERLMPQPPQDEPWGGRWVTCPDGSRIVISWLGKYNAETRVMHNMHRYELVKDGQLLETEWEELDVRLYEMPEIQSLLEKAGFSEIKLWKPYASIPPAKSDERFVVECVSS